MIHIVEGPDGAGKSTFVKRLSADLGLPVLRDPALTFFKGRWRDAVEIQRLGDVYYNTVAQFGPIADAITDRCWPTSVAFAMLYPDRPPLEPYLRDPVALADQWSEWSVLYHVDAPDDVLVSRLEERGERTDAVRGAAAAYRDLFRMIEGAGITVRRVDGTAPYDTQRSWL